MGDKFDRLKQLQTKVSAFLEERGIETHDDERSSRFHRFAHFWLLVIKSFDRNRCPLRASALAYTTLLSLIPLLAVVLSVSASLLKDQGERGIKQMIDTVVSKAAFQLDLTPKPGDVRAPAVHEPFTNIVAVGPNELAPQISITAQEPELAPTESLMQLSPIQVGTNVLALTQSWTNPFATTETRFAETKVRYEQKSREVAQQIFTYINNVRSGSLGATGVIALMFVGISLLATIESTFNDIWGVVHGRTWFSRIVQYWAALTLGPVLLILVFTLKNAQHLQRIPYFSSALESFKDSAVFGVVVPFVILTITFSLLYQLIPNTRVNSKAALVGGLVGAFLWQVNSWMSFIYVSQVVRSSEIYGGLGAVPILLIGLYFSWLIVLFGAQVAYAYQNRRAYLQERQAESVNQRGREFVALRIMTFVGQRFQKGERPATVTEIAEILSIPSRLVSKVLEPLLLTKLVVEVAGSEVAYAPARPLDKINYQNVLDSVRAGMGQELETRHEVSREVVKNYFDKIRDAERRIAGEVTLLSLTRELEVRESEATTERGGIIRL